MNPADRKKMCSSCDGVIPIESEICPYCTADQAHDDKPQTSPYQAPLFKHQSLQDSLTSLYTPPYSSNKGQVGQEPDQSKASLSKRKKDIQEELYHNNEIRREPPAMVLPSSEMDGSEEQKQEMAQGGTFWSVFLLSLGAILLNLGLLQLFFSDNGILRLEWNSTYWFVYCFISLPLFYIGFKKVNGLK